ncbi:reverse transcriptase domain-containing protein [Tanacetum coccineum]
MTAIFHELIKDSMEVFMDDFSIFGSSFDHYLKNLEKMLKRCEETNLVLNWEKCHFMVKDGIVLGHKVSGSGIEVYKAKIKAISKLPYPTNVKAIRSFLGHAGFYKRFIKDFSQVTHPMTQLLVKDVTFNFSEECIQAFDKLKHKLKQASNMIKLDWSLPFKVMCDASDYAFGAMLGQRIDKHFKPIHYASKRMHEAQRELHYDREGTFGYRSENLVADHLSRLENLDLGKLTKAEIMDLFLEERLMAISNKNNEHWYVDYANYLASHIESYEGVSQDMRRYKSFDNVTAAHQEGIMVEAQAFPASDARNVVKFLKRLFARFGIPKALISDRGIHFCNYQMEKAMKRYGVVHRFSMAYHLQTNGQVENTNRAIKRILKKTIENNRKDWSHKLDDALWAFRIAFKTPLGIIPFRIIYGKACHLPVEFKHKAYWAIKNCNMDLTKAEANRFLHINELDEMKLDAYESSISYKERTKRLFPGKLKSRWYGQFSVSRDMKNGAIELYDEDGNELIINKQRNGYSLKDKNKGKTDKTEHENGNSVKSRSQRRVHLKWANPYQSSWAESDH